MIYAVISPMVRIGCNCVRHRFVARRWLLVPRKENLKRTRATGLEVDPILVRRYCLSIHEIFIINCFAGIENDLRIGG